MRLYQLLVQIIVLSSCQLYPLILMNAEGDWVRNNETLKYMTVDFFKACILQQVLGIFSQLGANKAPGPDGLNGLFFQQHWQDIGGDILREVQRLFESRTLNPALNRTHITLIPAKMQFPLWIIFIGGRLYMNHYAQYASRNRRRLSTTCYFAPVILVSRLRDIQMKWWVVVTTFLILHCL